MHCTQLHCGSVWRVSYLCVSRSPPPLLAGASNAKRPVASLRLHRLRSDCRTEGETKHCLIESGFINGIFPGSWLSMPRPRHQSNALKWSPGSDTRPRRRTFFYGLKCKVVPRTTAPLQQVRSASDVFLPPYTSRLPARRHIFPLRGAKGALGPCPFYENVCFCAHSPRKGIPACAYTFC